MNDKLLLVPEIKKSIFYLWIKCFLATVTRRLWWSAHERYVCECMKNCLSILYVLESVVAGRLNRWVNIRKHKAKSTRSTSCAWLTFNFANGLRIWSVSLLRCVPEILSISRLLSGTKMPNGMLVMSAIDNDRSSVRFWNTGRISNKFNCTFPLILRVCSLGNWHM